LRWIAISIIVHLLILFIPLSFIQEDTKPSIKLTYEFKRKVEEKYLERKIKEKKLKETLFLVSKPLNNKQYIFNKKTSPLYRLSEKRANDTTVEDVIYPDFCQIKAFSSFSPQVKTKAHKIRPSGKTPLLQDSFFSWGKEGIVKEGKEKMITFGKTKAFLFTQALFEPSSFKMRGKNFTSISRRGSHPKTKKATYHVRQSSPLLLILSKEKPKQPSLSKTKVPRILTSKASGKRNLRSSSLSQNFAHSASFPFLLSSKEPKIITSIEPLTSKSTSWEVLLTGNKKGVSLAIHSPGENFYHLFTPEHGLFSRYYSRIRIDIFPERSFSSKNVSSKNIITKFSPPSKSVFYWQKISSSPAHSLLLSPREGEGKVFSRLPAPIVKVSSLTREAESLSFSTANFSLPNNADIMGKSQVFPLERPDISISIADYLKSIIAIIEKNKKYPSSARKKGKEGRVGISFTLSGSGEVVNVMVVSPSEHLELNEAAKALIYKLSPLPPFPEKINKKSITLKMEVVYELKEKS